MNEINNYLDNLSANRVAWVNKNSIYKYDVAQYQKLQRIDEQCNFESDVRYFGDSKEANQLLDDLGELFRAMFIESKSDRKLSFDISEVGGMSASKSKLNECATMEHFVERNCRPYFEITADDLKANLKHSEIRVISRDKTYDNICIYGWKDTLYLSNSGGSHHFATAQYIAGKLDVSVPISANFTFIRIDESAVKEFNQEYTALLIPNHDFAFLGAAVNQLNVSAVAYQLPNNASTDATLLIYRKSAISNDTEIKFQERYTDFNNELLKVVYQQRSNFSLKKYYESQVSAA